MLTHGMGSTPPPPGLCQSACFWGLTGGDVGEITGRLSRSFCCVSGLYCQCYVGMYDCDWKHVYWFSDDGDLVYVRVHVFGV